MDWFIEANISAFSLRPGIFNSVKVTLKTEQIGEHKQKSNTSTYDQLPCQHTQGRTREVTRWLIFHTFPAICSIDHRSCWR